MPHSEKDPGNVDMIGRMIMASGRTIGCYDPDQLARLVALHRTLDRAVVAAVAGQRRSGVTWRSIGQALGVTKEAVIQAYGPAVREMGSVK